MAGGPVGGGVGGSALFLQLVKQRLGGVAGAPLWRGTMLGEPPLGQAAGRVSGRMQAQRSPQLLARGRHSGESHQTAGATEREVEGGESGATEPCTAA